MSIANCGGEQFKLALACAWQFAWQLAAALQLSIPVHEGGVVVTVQLPWQLPMHVADPGVYEHVPLHMPVQLAPAWTLQLPVHIPMHWPPVNMPVHAAEQLPLACASHVPSHLPLQVVPEADEPSHIPVHLPPHDPLKLAVQPAAHVPVHIGASQLPEHSPMHWTAAVAVHDPLHVPMQAKLGAVTSQVASHEPLQPTTTSPPVQLALTSQLALAVQLASQVPWTMRSAWHWGGWSVSVIESDDFSAAMYVLRTLHASLAVVFVVSRLRSALISLQTLSHWACVFAAAV
jgi:hypothetical protein